MNKKSLEDRISDLEARLASSEQRYAQFVKALDYLPNGIEVYDREGLAEYLNPSMMKMIALPSSDVVLGKFNILTDRFSVETGMKALYERAYAGEVVHTEEFMVEMDRASDDWGTDVRSAWFRMVLVPIKDLDGAVEKVFAIMFESTQQRQMQATMRSASRREGLELLAGGIAHDYNNLLTAIIMSAGFMDSVQTDPATVATLSQEILLASEQARFLTDQLQIYAGKNNKTIESLDIARLTHETARMLESTMSTNVVLHMSASRSSLFSLVNEGQFKQVVMNLITNAHGALEASGGQISVTSKLVCLDAEAIHLIKFAGEAAPGPWHCIEVKDDGCGMDHNTLTRMFEPYFTTKASGQGLGLAATLGIIRDYDGGIRVDSTVGIGTCVRIYLQVSSQVSTETVMWTAAEMPVFDRVVIADDSAFVRASLRQVFQRVGVTVEEAVNGEEVVALVVSPRIRPDLLILGLMMPVMNGLDAIAMIRQHEPSLPVILMSAHTDTGRSAVEGDSAMWFIEKPFKYEALLNIVSAALST